MISATAGFTYLLAFLPLFLQRCQCPLEAPRSDVTGQETELRWQRVSCLGAAPSAPTTAAITHHPPLIGISLTSRRHKEEPENILFAQKPHIVRAELLPHQERGADVGRRFLQRKLTARGTRSLLVQPPLILNGRA